MTTLLANTAIEEQISNLIQDKLGKKTLSLLPMEGGANSHVFKVTTENNAEYLAKRYRSRAGDNRDRLKTEFSSYSFLWKNGMRFTPEPFCFDKESQLAVYSFIDGKKLKPGEVVKRDVEEASKFLRELHALRNVKGAELQPVASEACFSISAYVKKVEERLERLKNTDKNNGEVFKRLHDFLDNSFIPFFEELKVFLQNKAQEEGIDIEQVLNDSERTLSPSDFGYHNGIRCPDNSVIFIDFEYFGWDDPAKTISDFYLQPMIPVPVDLRMTFYNNLIGMYDEDGAVSKRIPLVYSFCALKWCLLMLNVFFFGASKDDDSYEEKCFEQLRKTEKKFNESQEEFENKAFPLSLLEKKIISNKKI